MKFDKNIKITLVAFILMSLGIFYLKPKIMFNNDGSFKQFGLTKDKTIYPFWLISIIIGLIIYLLIIIKYNDYI